MRPRVRLIFWGVLLEFISTATDPTAAVSVADPPLVVKETVVLVLGLEVARGASGPEIRPEPANRKQMLANRLTCLAYSTFCFFFSIILSINLDVFKCSVCLSLYLFFLYL